jgi:RNA-directed DNA polymerase
VVTVLNEIYEEDFRGFSYGFRPGRGQHMALDALYVAIKRKRVNWILDLDLKSFFDNISHGKLVQLIEKRIADPRVLRLIQKLKWLKAGVHEAERFLRELKEHLREYGLELNEDKTRLIRFGRFARLNRAEREEGKPEAFTFLGLQHICGSNGLGRFEVRRITDGKRRRSKLQELKQALRRRMHAPIATVGEWLRRVLRGYYQYPCGTGKPGDAVSIPAPGGPLWYQTLCQRSQRRPTWAKLGPTLDHW